MSVLTVATRGGSLAIKQTQIIIASLKKKHPDMQFKIKRITTKGDRDRQTALWQLKTSGFFTTKVEDALLQGQADFAVHSFKDLPTHPRQGLTIAAVCDRQFAQDCLIASDLLSSIADLKHSAKIGTSSLRRKAQIKHLRPDLQILPIRGNVITRIRKVSDGKFDAVILARAGLERLGITNKICFSFKPEQFIPAPAQGALAVQTRTDDTITIKLINTIDDKNVRTTTLAERKILTTMQCGCHAPVGAFAQISQEQITIVAFISDLQGQNFIRKEITGPAANAENLAAKLANELLQAGGRQILENLEK
ncbi:MAG: hydroxymethylbilane synthase [Planctomycetota bacterium]|jgi:hydroxymethylbilane synthase